jgi:hypothetical protein
MWAIYFYFRGKLGRTLGDLIALKLGGTVRGLPELDKAYLSPPTPPTKQGKVRERCSIWGSDDWTTQALIIG